MLILSNNNTYLKQSVQSTYLYQQSAMLYLLVSPSQPEHHLPTLAPVLVSTIHLPPIAGNNSLIYKKGFFTKQLGFIYFISLVAFKKYQLFRKKVMAIYNNS